MVSLKTAVLQRQRVSCVIVSEEEEEREEAKFGQESKWLWEEKSEVNSRMAITCANPMALWYLRIRFLKPPSHIFLQNVVDSL